MTRHFYAISYRYGANMRNADTGELIGRIVQFPTAAARDAWVDAGTVHYRKAIPTHGEAGRLIRKELRGRYGDNIIMDQVEFDTYYT